MLKARVSYGLTGNNGIGLYDTYGSYNSLYTYNGNATTTTNTMPNNGLIWEKTLQINAGIDRMAEEAKETMNLLSDKIDRATRCGNEKAARIKRSAKAGLRRTTDAVQETVDRTAERIRDKLSE